MSLLKYISDEKQISFKESHWKYAFLEISKYKPFFLWLDLLQIFRIDEFTVLLKRYTIEKENEMLAFSPSNPSPSLQNYCWLTSCVSFLWGSGCKTTTWDKRGTFILQASHTYSSRKTLHGEKVLYSIPHF